MATKLLPKAGRGEGTTRTPGSSLLRRGPGHRGPRGRGRGHRTAGADAAADGLQVTEGRSGRRSAASLPPREHDGRHGTAAETLMQAAERRARGVDHPPDPAQPPRPRSCPPERAARGPGHRRPEAGPGTPSSQGRGRKDFKGAVPRSRPSPTTPTRQAVGRFRQPDPAGLAGRAAAAGDGVRTRNCARQGQVHRAAGAGHRPEGRRRGRWYDLAATADATLSRPCKNRAHFGYARTFPE